MSYFYLFMCICCFHTISNTNSFITKYMQKTYNITFVGIQENTNYLVQAILLWW
jgi:hypothetical protein